MVSSTLKEGANGDGAFPNVAARRGGRGSDWTGLSSGEEVSLTAVWSGGTVWARFGPRVRVSGLVWAGTSPVDVLAIRDNSLGEMMYWPTFFFGTGGISSPKEENDDRVDEVWLWLVKKFEGGASNEPGDEERVAVAVAGRCPDILARLFCVLPVEGRRAVPVLVLGRDEEPKEAALGEEDGRTPDIDARDCMNLRKSTPFSLTSSLRADPLVMSIVARDAAVNGKCWGRAGTGGGAGFCWYFSRRPPVLIRFINFDHIVPGELTSSLSLPFDLEARDMRPSSCGEALFFVGLGFVVGDSLGLLLPPTVVSRVMGFWGVLFGACGSGCRGLCRPGTPCEPSYGFH